jgi:putative membrane protein
MSWEQIHPAINAALNLTCFVFLVAGRTAIARGDRALHRKRMLAAFTASSVFLVSYLIRVATQGRHDYPGAGWDRTLYLIILFSHMALAFVLVPLVLTALRRALRGDFAAHRRIVRFAWPVWMYVSVTGVIVYLMLYHLAPVLHPVSVAAVH